MIEKDENGTYIEINKMLTMSTGHVTEETFNGLLNDHFDPLPVYAKKMKDDIIGCFIYLEQAYVESEAMDWESMPEDLRSVIRYALEQGCSVLCLDRDGIEMDNVLKVYDWVYDW